MLLSGLQKVVKGKPLYVGLAEKREVRAERLRGLEWLKLGGAPEREKVYIVWVRPN